MRIAALWAEKTLSLLVSAVFMGLALLPALQIVLRLAGRPFIGAEELTRFFLICLVFLGYPLVVAAGENIAMGELRAILPAAAGKTLNAAIAAASAATALFVAYAAHDTVFKNLKNATPTLAIPFWLFLSSTFAAYLLAGVIHVRELFRALFQAGSEREEPGAGAGERA